MWLRGGVWLGGGCDWEEGVVGRRVWLGGGCGWEEGVAERRSAVGGGCDWEEGVVGRKGVGSTNHTLPGSGLYDVRLYGGAVQNRTLPFTA